MCVVSCVCEMYKTSQSSVYLRFIYSFAFSILVLESSHTVGCNNLDQDMLPVAAGLGNLDSLVDNCCSNCSHYSLETRLEMHLQCWVLNIAPSDDC